MRLVGRLKMKMYDIQTRNTVAYSLRSVLVKAGQYLGFFSLLFAFTTPSFSFNVYNKNTVKFEATQTYKSQKIQLRAKLLKPKGTGPFPSVILMHGCGGWQPAVQATLSSYTDFLVQNGFAVLDLDSFGPRRNSGGEVCASYKELKKARDYRTSDAFDAIKYLKEQDFVDANNIFLMGQSNGGSVAINVAKSNKEESNFRAIVAYYPWCGAFGGSKVELSSPLLILGGAKDDWVPPQGCNNVVSNGEELRVTIYPNAPHSFDINILQQRYMGKLVGYDKHAAQAGRTAMLTFFTDHLTFDSKQKRIKLSLNQTP